MLQLKTILKVLYPADVVLPFLKTSFLLHSMMLRGSSFYYILLDIRSVSDVLRAQSRFCKICGGEAADLITNLSRRQPLFSRK